MTLHSATVPRPRSDATSDRRPYERPRITFREPLEAVAAICTPPNGKVIFPCVISSS